MVTKSKQTAVAKKGRVKVGKLKLKKETVKELSSRQEKRIKGGAVAPGLGTPACRER
jgi:natural product precursor